MDRAAPSQDNTGERLPLLAAAISGARGVLLTTHEMADGDAAGSEVALARGLRALGLRVYVVNNEALSTRHRYLDPEGEIVQVYDRTDFARILGEIDLAILLDNNAIERLGRLREPLTAPDGPRLACLDHHPFEREVSDLHVVDTKAAATGVLVHRLLTLLRAPADAPLRTALFSALACDTGWFRHTNTTPDVLRFAADLLEAGLDREAVHASFFHNDSVESQRLLAKVLERVEVTCQGRFVWSHVTRKMARRIGCGLAEAEGFIERLRGVKGAQVAMLLREPERGVVKVSLRSRPGYSALTLARALGGGGHELAAGATVRGVGIDDLARRIIAHFEATHRD